MPVKSQPSQLRAYWALSWYALKASLRNKSTLFFSLIFPVVLIGAFGLIGNFNTTYKIGVPNGTDPNNPILKTVDQIQVLKTQSGSSDQLDQDLVKGKIDGVLEIQPKSPTGYNVNLYTSSANQINAAAVKSIFQGIVDKDNLVLSNITNPPVTLNNKEVSGRQARYIDFILPGQIGFSLLSTALFGTVFGFIALRRLQVLRRLFTTPVKPITILASQGTSRLILALIQTTVILGLGVLIFHFYLPNGIITFIELLFISTLGLISFMGFGLFLSGLSSDENSAGPLVNLVSLPQMLLSGVFFSTDSLPVWIKPIADNLPLSYFNHAVRQITTEGGSFVETFPYILGFVVWGVVMYLLATRTFKWE